MNSSKKHYWSSVLPCMASGILCGTVTGAAIFLFKIAAKKADQIAHRLYSLASGSVLYLVLVFALLALFAWVMVQIHKKVPEAKGGGIYCSPDGCYIGDLLGMDEE